MMISVVVDRYTKEKESDHLIKKQDLYPAFLFLSSSALFAAGDWDK